MSSNYSSLRRIAVLSLHTSPLAQPGTGNGGGMNVYVRALASASARAGIECDVFTRSDSPGLAPIVEVEPGFRVIHVPVGPQESLGISEIAGQLGELGDETVRLLETTNRPYDAVHANYWISGAVGHRVKHDLGIPLAATFHTLARVKAEIGIDDDPLQRAEVEVGIAGCSDLILASTRGEADQLADFYAADEGRIEIVQPGVDHRTFSPGDKSQARRLLGIGKGPMILFVGRIQRLKGADIAIRSLSLLANEQSNLFVIGGPSGDEGDNEFERLHALAEALGIAARVHFIEPQNHLRLTAYYRAADALMVPSQTESFGLVALEAAACGTPVIASAVGGLCSIIEDGKTGFLVGERDPVAFASRVQTLLDDGAAAAAMGAAAAAHSRQFNWSVTAAKLRRLYLDLSATEPCELLDTRRS